MALLFQEFRTGPSPSLLVKALAGGVGLRSAPTSDLRLSVPVVCFCDAGSVVEALHTSKWQVRSKRRRVDLASIKEAMEIDGIRVLHCLTWEMLADGLTKDPVGQDHLLQMLMDVMHGSVALPDAGNVSVADPHAPQGA